MFRGVRGWGGLFLVTAALSLAHAEAVTVHTFPNGMKWIHRPVRHNRIVAFQLFIPGGSVQEPAEQAGLTQLMTATMVKGTHRRNALALAQEMEMLGASVGVDAQFDLLSAGGQTPIDKWDKTFDLFEDILLHPSFPEEEVEKERAALLNTLKTNDEHIFNVAEERFRRELFGAHPYGRPEEGTEATVAGLTRDQLVAWHRRCVGPRGAVLVTVGRIPLGRLQRRVEDFARAWSAPAPSSVEKNTVVYPTAPKVAEEKASFEQAYLMVGFPAPAVDSPRYPALKLMNALLGGGMSSPLFQSIREEGTLAYEVSSFYPSRKEGSSFVVYAGMDPKNLILAEAKIRSLLENFSSHPPTSRDLDDAKNYLRGHFLMDHQTNSRLAWYLGWWEFLGKGYGYDKVYPEEIARLSAEDINAIARDILNQPSVTVRVSP